MSEKRKNNKGRLLRAGESQRKDLTYQFHYTDVTGKRRTVYTSDLQELRKKEKTIQKDIDDGINYCEGNVTVIELLERYIALKQGVRHATKVGYNFVLNLAKKEAFCYRTINTIRTSDAKLWLMKLQKDGRGYSTIASVRDVVKPAFQMAVDDDQIRKNPFAFKLSSVVANDTQKRNALIPEQQRIFMDFVKHDSHYSRYYNEFYVLLGTGMRVSEFCGLTLGDLDDSGVRDIPMTSEVYESLQYLMGHSDAAITMNVYTHSSYSKAEESMRKAEEQQLHNKRKAG